MTDNSDRNENMTIYRALKRAAIIAGRSTAADLREAAAALIELKAAMIGIDSPSFMQFADTRGERRIKGELPLVGTSPAWQEPDEGFKAFCELCDVYWQFASPTKSPLTASDARNRILFGDHYRGGFSVAATVKDMATNPHEHAASCGISARLQAGQKSARGSSR